LRTILYILEIGKIINFSFLKNLLGLLAVAGSVRFITEGYIEKLYGWIKHSHIVDPFLTDIDLDKPIPENIRVLDASHNIIKDEDIFHLPDNLRILGGCGVLPLRCDFDQ